MKRTEEIGREEGYAEAWRGATGKQPTPLTFPNFFFLVFFVVEEDRERRRRRDRQDCIFNGKSKDKNRREMNKGEGKTKQGTEKRRLFFIDPLSLISSISFSCLNKESKKEKL